MVRRAAAHTVPAWSGLVQPLQQAGVTPVEFFESPRDKPSGQNLSPRASAQRRPSSRSLKRHQSEGKYEEHETRGGASPLSPMPASSFHTDHPSPHRTSEAKPSPVRKQQSARSGSGPYLGPSKRVAAPPALHLEPSPSLSMRQRAESFRLLIPDEAVFNGPASAADSKKDSGHDDHGGQHSRGSSQGGAVEDVLMRSQPRSTPRRDSQQQPQQQQEEAGGQQSLGGRQQASSYAGRAAASAVPTSPAGGGVVRGGRARRNSLEMDDEGLILPMIMAQELLVPSARETSSPVRFAEDLQQQTQQQQQQGSQQPGGGPAATTGSSVQPGPQQMGIGGRLLMVETLERRRRQALTVNMRQKEKILRAHIRNRLVRR